MSAFLFFYYLLMLVCFAASAVYRRFPLVTWLCALLVASIATEAAVEIIGHGQQKHYPVYHLFIPLEYTLVTLALRSQASNRRLRKAMLVSVFGFWPLCAYISFFVVRPTDFPGTAIGMEAVLVIAWSLLTLVYIEPVSELSIFRLPAFWVALGFLIYFSSTVALSTVYNYLVHSQTEKAKAMFDVITNISNCLLYIFLTIGIVCHRGPTKSSAP